MACGQRSCFERAKTNARVLRNQRHPLTVEVLLARLSGMVIGHFDADPKGGECDAAIGARAHGPMAVAQAWPSGPEARAWCLRSPRRNW